MNCPRCDIWIIDILTENDNGFSYKCDSCNIIIDVIIHNISPEVNLPIEEILNSVRQKPIDFKK